MRLFAIVVLCLSLSLSGCGGGGNSAGGTGGGSAAPVNYAVGGTVTGLAGRDLVLRNGSDSLTVAADGSFAFPTRLSGGTAYSVTVGTQPANPAQTCSVANGGGTIAAADVTGVLVTCATTGAVFAYAAVLNYQASPDGKLQYFTVEPATGALTLRGTVLGSEPLTSFETVRTVGGGKQLLVSTGTQTGAGQVATVRADLTLYDLSAATGVPSRSRLLASPGGASLIHPNGQDVYGATARALTHYTLAQGGAQGPSLALNLYGPYSPVIIPNGAFVLIPGGTDGAYPREIAVVSLADPANPRLGTGFAVPVRPLTLVVTPDNRRLYVLPIDDGDPGLIYALDSSANAVELGRFAAPRYVRDGVVTPDGRFLYLVSGMDGRLQAYRIDSMGGLTDLGSVAVPEGFRTVLGPGGQYLYVLSRPVDGSPGAIYGFAIGAGGALTAVPGSPFNSGGNAYDLTFATPNP